MPPETAPAETPEDAIEYEYIVESQWAGFWGGYGTEGALERRINSFAVEGWRLVQTERIWALWWWWLPRPKLLYVLERVATDEPTDDQSDS